MNICSKTNRRKNPILCLLISPFLELCNTIQPTYFDQVSDKRCEEHVVQMQVFILQHILQTSACRVCGKNANVPVIHRSSNERDYVLVTKLSNLQNPKRKQWVSVTKTNTILPLLLVTWAGPKPTCNNNMNPIYNYVHFFLPPPICILQPCNFSIIIFLFQHIINRIAHTDLNKFLSDVTSKINAPLVNRLHRHSHPFIEAYAGVSLFTAELQRWLGVNSCAQKLTANGNLFPSQESFTRNAKRTIYNQIM